MGRKYKRKEHIIGNRRSYNEKLREKSVDKSKKGNRRNENVKSRSELNKNA